MLVLTLRDFKHVKYRISSKISNNYINNRSQSMYILMPKISIAHRMHKESTFIHYRNLNIEHNAI